MSQGSIHKKIEELKEQSGFAQSFPLKPHHLKTSCTLKKIKSHHV